MKLKEMLREKRKIKEELSRHWFFVKSFIPFLLSVIFLFSLLPFFSFPKTLFSIFFFIFSSFFPDVSFISLKLISKNSLENLRKKTHSFYSSIIYTIFLLFLLPFFFSINFLDSFLFSSFSFFGYFLHLLIDKYEDFLEEIKKLKNLILRKVLSQFL
jgi:hypothetical protein